MADTEVDVADVQLSAENKKAENGVAHSPTGKGMACELAPAEDYHTTKRDAAVKIRFSGNEVDITNTPAITVMEYVKRAMEKFPDRIAMKVEREGRWISWTYREYMQEIRTVGKAFIKVISEASVYKYIVGTPSSDIFPGNLELSYETQPLHEFFFLFCF